MAGLTASGAAHPPLFQQPLAHPPLLHKLVRRADVARELEVVPDPLDVGALEVDRVDGTSSRVSSILAGTFTDTCVVVQDGGIVFERYGEHGHPERAHPLLSLSKPVVGCVAAVLIERGDLDPERLVTDYVPELEGSGYRGATVRHVLDMRTGVRFSEEYANPMAEIRELDRWIAQSRRGGGGPYGLYPYLCTLEADAPHGGEFRYRSAEADVLGWACERAAGSEMPELVSSLLWQPMGAGQDADFVCDGNGTALHDGGLSATARDVARFGQLLLDGGTAPDGVGGTRAVVPLRWMRQAWAVDADVRGAFASSPAEQMFPGGWYRNQFWFRPGPHGDVLVCLGIYGQMIHVSRRTRTVCVKLSSWPEPQSPAHLQDTIRAFDAIGGALARSDASDTRQRLPGVIWGLNRKGSASPAHDSVI
ncbi:MAG: serine hydrolase [Dermatophilaceae bacterium]|nr:serine hydrolase [Dermatophilaceae bacterium]